MELPYGNLAYGHQKLQPVIQIVHLYTRLRCGYKKLPWVSNHTTSQHTTTTQHTTPHNTTHHNNHNAIPSNNLSSLFHHRTTMPTWSHWLAVNSLVEYDSKLVLLNRRMSPVSNRRGIMVLGRPRVCNSAFYLFLSQGKHKRERERGIYRYQATALLQFDTHNNLIW